MIYQETHDRLVHAARQIVHHRESFARSLIHASIRDYVGIELSNEELLGHIMAQALSHRIDRNLLDQRNIYVEKFDIPQTELFYSMARAVPFVGTSHAVANQFAFSSASGADEVTIFDIGVGRGRQLVSLISMFAERIENCVKSINVIALDPVQDNVDSSRLAVEEAKSRLSIDIPYLGICAMIEELSPDEIERIRRSVRGALVINSAFTLHHTAHEPGDATRRTRLFEQLKSLDPVALTLIEPSSNHDTEDLPKRVHHAWQHYGTVFALVDDSDIEESHKHSIKTMFFGREIQDIFAVSDRFRSERHEEFESWLLRLHRTGFRPVPANGVSAELPDHCEMTVSDGLARMNYRDLTIVAVFAVR